MIDVRRKTAAGSNVAVDVGQILSVNDLKAQLSDSSDDLRASLQDAIVLRRSLDNVRPHLVDNTPYQALAIE